MEGPNFTEILKSIEKQLPLMYISAALILSGMLVLSFTILNLMNSKASRKLTIILSIVLIMLASGIGIYFSVVFSVVSN